MSSSKLFKKKTFIGTVPTIHNIIGTFQRKMFCFFLQDPKLSTCKLGIPVQYTNLPTQTKGEGNSKKVYYYKNTYHLQTDFNSSKFYKTIQQ